MGQDKTDEDKFVVAQPFSFGLMSEVIDQVKTGLKNKDVLEGKNYIQECDENFVVGISHTSLCRLQNISVDNINHQDNLIFFHTPNHTVQKAQLTRAGFQFDAEDLLNNKALQSVVTTYSQLAVQGQNQISSKTIENTIYYSMASGVETMHKTGIQPDTERYRIGDHVILVIRWVNYWQDETQQAKRMKTHENAPDGSCPV